MPLLGPKLPQKGDEIIVSSLLILKSPKAWSLLGILASPVKSLTSFRECVDAAMKRLFLIKVTSREVKRDLIEGSGEIRRCA